MQRKTLFHIVAEGWLVLGALAVVLVIVNAVLGIWAGALVLAGMAACALFFRDSPRSVPAAPLSVIAPVDGLVIDRRECRDPYLDRVAVRITLQVSAFGTYLLRSPVEGKVLGLAGVGPGPAGGVASLIRTDEGDELVMAVRHGSLLGQRPCQKGYGERVGQGRCCGNRRLARRVELFMPAGSRMQAAPGVRVRAGTCVLAKLVHKKMAAAVPESQPGPGSGGIEQRLCAADSVDALD